MVISVAAFSQNKEERIERDIEVAENILSTLIKQQLDKKGGFWPLDVEGSYTEGYGVTLRVPYGNFPPMAFSLTTEDFKGPSWRNDRDALIQINGNTIIERKWIEDEIENAEIDEERAEREMEMIEKEKEMADREKEMAGKEKEMARKEKEKADKEKIKVKVISGRDSARANFGDKVLEAAKIFLADYGDLISLEPNEKILITTQSERGGYNFHFPGDPNMPKRKIISAEALKSDLTQYKQNKISRDQLISKFKVVNSELSNEVKPDLELLSTIFNRLYSSDLSKTFFVENAPYYEIMKDFGVTYSMQVYSSNINHDRFSMPTLDLDNLDQAERDKKVKELYPLFEKDIKDSMVEYGRTITSLKDNELLIFNITLTKCKGCGIPSDIELSVKASVLKDFGSGKISKEAAVGKVSIKKGAIQ